MAANSWTIDGTAASLLGAQPAPQPGESETYEFKLNPSHSSTVASVHERYNALRPRWKHANTVSVDTTFDDKVIYNEGRGDAALAEFAIVDDPLGRGFWGLITDGDDKVETIDDGSGQEIAATLSLEVAYIADLAQYPDKQAVRDVHERRGFH